MAQKKKEEEIIPAGQEDKKELTASNREIEEGVLVRPKEDTVIYGTKGSLLGDGVKHTVHRVLAEKLIAKKQATDKAPTKKEPTKKELVEEDAD